MSQASHESTAGARSGAAPVRAVVDLGAIADNVRALRRVVGDAEVMAVVKADGYGHGAVQAARAALAGGASWLGVAELSEALELRAAGIRAPLLFWLYGVDEDLRPAVDAGIDVGVSSLRAVDQICAAAAAAGRAARVHVKIDTGLSRNGATPQQWLALIDAVREAEMHGLVQAVAVFSHLANADVPGDASIAAQRKVFLEAIDAAAGRGVHFGLRHMSNTPGVFASDDLHFDLVRTGIGIYGLSPFADRDPASLGLRPALRLLSQVVQVKRVAAGSGVSYGSTYRTERETTLALVPAGYGDGIPRAASNRGEVAIRGRRYRVAGRIAMDQFVVDVGDDRVRIGDEVVLIGSGANEPTADDWARAADTINYEIVTRLGHRIPRHYLGAGAR